MSSIFSKPSTGNQSRYWTVSRFRISDIVATQFKDLRRALVSRGQYRLADTHRQFGMTRTVWVSKTDSERQRLYRRFMQTARTQGQEYWRYNDSDSTKNSWEENWTEEEKTQREDHQFQEVQTEWWLTDNVMTDFVKVTI
jgi:hypothetical protein